VLYFSFIEQNLFGGAVSPLRLQRRMCPPFLSRVRSSFSRRAYPFFSPFSFLQRWKTEVTPLRFPYPDQLTEDARSENSSGFLGRSFRFSSLYSQVGVERDTTPSVWTPEIFASSSLPFFSFSRRRRDLEFFPLPLTRRRRQCSPFSPAGTERCPPPLSSLFFIPRESPPWSLLPLVSHPPFWSWCPFSFGGIDTFFSFVLCRRHSSRHRFFPFFFFLSSREETEKVPFLSF